ncbi:hypothetical protein MKX03_015817 [Papaver bracteatum]|nr:hypothetical protein MKX03_015817 [Papaver bracteatum]
MRLCDEKELEECINKGIKIEDTIKKIIDNSRRQKLALKKECKKKEKVDKEMLAVKRKYYELRKPLYDERSEHIKSIPHFCPTAFLSYKNLGKHLSDQDEKIIEFLESVVVDDSQNEKSVTFFFKKNQYFKNLVLKKVYSHTGKGIVESGTEILWNKRTDTTTGSETEDPAFTDTDNSFFTRFFDPQDKDLPKKPRDEVLEAIEEDLWPHALAHFLNGEKKMLKEEQGDTSKEIKSDQLV